MVLKNKYYLADIDYSNSGFAIIPYWGLQYYLQEKNFTGQKSENTKKICNL